MQINGVDFLDPASSEVYFSTLFTGGASMQWSSWWKVIALRQIWSQKGLALHLLSAGAIFEIGKTGVGGLKKSTA